MKLKSLVLASSMLLVAVPGISSAENTFSGNVALTTDYVWRGISQTDEDPAIQGGFDWEHSSGFSAGVWASNVDFDSDASMELDLYASFSKEFNGVALSVGFIHYDYPSESNLDFNEINFGIGYGAFSAMVSYTDEFGDGGEEAIYYELGADFDLPVGGLALGLHAGYYDIDSSDGESYTDWKIALSKEAGGFNFELAYTDTDLSKTECGGNTCDGRAIFTVSKSF